MKKILIIVFSILANISFSQTNTAKQGFQKIGLTGTMTNYNSVLQSDAKFSTGALTLGGSTAVLSSDTKLKVIGNIELDNSIGGTTGDIYKGGNLFLHTKSNNTALGAFALMNTTGSGNVAFGENALNVNTTGNTNTAIGTFSLRNNLTQSDNTATGYFSGSGLTGNSNSLYGAYSSYNISSADYITAIGSYSLYNNRASYNLGVGYKALGNDTWTTAGAFVTGTTYQIKNVGTTNFTLVGAASNLVGGIFTASGAGSGTGQALALITGGNNVAIGNNALSKNTTGFDNTAIGSISMTSNKGGTHNTSIGSQSLASNITGITNTAIGYSSLYKNNSGSYNTAIGYSSLYNNNSGSYNTAIGYTSLKNNTSGNYNIAIGYQALINTGTPNLNIGIGRSTLKNTLIGQNIAIGDEAGLQNYLGQNCISIGTTAGGTIVSVPSTGLVSGSSYQITVVGTSNFVLSGSSNNLVGTSFTATGSTTGTGSCILLQSGNSNILIGSSAGALLSVGSNNTFLGSDAGNNASQFMPAQNSIAIGANTYTTASNQVVLGDSNITQTILSGVITKRALDTAPASSTATGTTGEIRVTATHIYVCTATNTWVRTALTTF